MFSGALWWDGGPEVANYQVREAADITYFGYSNYYSGSSPEVRAHN